MSRSSRNRDERTQAVAFLRAVAVRSAGRAEPHPFGVALFDKRLPWVWDRNLVWVDRVPGGTTAKRLACEVDRIQGAAGLGHRKLVIADERDGKRLVPGLLALGWPVEPRVLMAHRREPDRPAEPGLAREVGEDVVRGVTEASLDAEGRLSHEAVCQILEARLASRSGAEMRSFAADADGRPAAVCDLYSDGPTAQIEAVLTLEEHRGKGLARAVVLAALAAAKAAGAEFVFLQADENDWPQELYRRLGFDPVGRTWVFERRV